MVGIIFLKGHDEDVGGVRTHEDWQLTDARQIATGLPSCLIRRLLLGAVTDAILYHSALGGGLSHRDCTEYKQSLPAGLGSISAVFHPDVHIAFYYHAIDVTIDVMDYTVLGRLRAIMLLGIWGADSTQYFSKG